MIKKLFAAPLALCILLCSFAFLSNAAGDDTAGYESGALEIEIDLEELAGCGFTADHIADTEEVEAIAAAIAEDMFAFRTENVVERLSEVSAVPDTEPIPGEAATEHTDYSGRIEGGNVRLCKGDHDLVGTTAYYTEHLAYDRDPRCRVTTVAVTVCTKCDYISKKVLSEERVSYCHPSAAVKKGDVNGDGVVNARDVLLVMKKVVGVVPPGASFDPVTADWTTDGKINARDVVGIMLCVVRGH